ncbi:MAG: hypothetical protein JO100_11810 [Pseudonocardia sp.]|nr:hypothetical protein [Pseudonocardia sp.]
MSFAGRSDLLSFLDQLVKVDGGPQVTPGSGRPILVLEGCGGSGRSELLRSLEERWAARTPTARVDSLALPDDQTGLKRPLLAALMLGLSADVHGYKVSFNRVVLAYIAMSEPVQDPDPRRAVDVMVQRLNTYRDGGAVIELVAGLVATSVPGAGDLSEVFTKIAEQIVKRLRKFPWRARLNWKEALEWFGHQDQRLHRDPVRALVQLSVQAQSDNIAVRDDVDDLLVGALLADLRDSLNRIAARPWNAIVALDNSDTPMAAWLVAALVRVRQNLAAQGATPDPVTVVVASGGSLAASLVGQVPAGARWQESQLADLTAEDVRRTGVWLSIVVGGLSVDDVRQMAMAYEWPPSLGTRVVANAVHRLTSGHAAATKLVLRDLQAAPQLIDDMDRILRRQAPDAQRSIEQFLLDRIVAGLSLHQRVDPDLWQDLVTLSAARDRDEAQELRLSLRTPVEVAPMLFASSTLWSGTGPRNRLALEPFIRYLLLRALANRVEEPRWHDVFGTLLDRLSKSDLGGRLHHNLALGNITMVAEELGRLLPNCPGKDWLTLLDQTVATPHPNGDHSTSAQPLNTGIENSARVTRLVSQLHTIRDPCLSDRETLRRGYLLIVHDYDGLADTSPDGLTLFLARSDRYRRLANELA